MSWPVRIAALSKGVRLFPQASAGWDFTRGIYRIGNQQTRVVSALPGYTFTRASTGYAEDTNGNLISFASGVPRITNKGVLIEEARTNVLVRTQEFDNASWTKNALTVTANSVSAPDGTQTADTITDDGTSNPHVLYGTGATVTGGGAAYTASIFVKPGTARYIQFRGENIAVNTWAWTVLDTQTGSLNNNAAVTSSSATLLANGWWRLSVTWANNAVGANIVVGISNVATAPITSSGLGNSYAGTGLTAYIWGIQLEAGSFPTSYIPTTSSTATRAADVFSYGGFVPPSPYSIAAQATISAQTTGFPQMFSLDDGTTSNDAQIYFNAGAPQKLWGLVRVGGVAQAALDMGAASNSTLYVAAMRIAANDFAAVKTGGTVATDVVGSVPATTILRVGSGPATNIWNSYIQRLAIYPFAASDAQLQTISSGQF